MGKNNNPVSVWFWMFAIFVMAVPCVGAVMIVVWAFWGDNESRKNYFRALILWALILAALWTGLFLLGFWPEIFGFIQKQVHEIQQWSQWPKR